MVRMFVFGERTLVFESCLFSDVARLFRELNKHSELQFLILNQQG